MAEENDVLDAIQAARYLKINPQTVRRLARQGRIPAFRLGRTWRFKRSILDEWAGSHRTLDRSRNILVIDDEEAVRDVIRRSLAREGFMVRATSGGAEALELIRQNPPDLVLLDLKMPGMTGPEVLREIRKELGAVPVVILTAYPDSKLMSQAMRHSPITLLAKPFDPRQLLETVRSILQPR